MKSRLLMLLSLIVLGVGIIGAVLTRVDAPKPAAPWLRQSHKSLKY